MHFLGGCRRASPWSWIRSTFTEPNLQWQIFQCPWGTSPCCFALGCLSSTENKLWRGWTERPKGNCSSSNRFRVFVRRRRRKWRRKRRFFLVAGTQSTCLNTFCPLWLQDAANSMWKNQHHQKCFNFGEWVSRIIVTLMTVVTLCTIHICMKTPFDEHVWTPLETAFVSFWCVCLICQLVFKQKDQLRFSVLALACHVLAIFYSRHCYFLTSLGVYYCFLCSFSRNRVFGASKWVFAPHSSQQQLIFCGCSTFLLCGTIALALTMCSVNFNFNSWLSASDLIGEILLCGCGLYFKFYLMLHDRVSWFFSKKRKAACVWRREKYLGQVQFWPSFKVAGFQRHRPRAKFCESQRSTCKHLSV